MFLAGGPGTEAIIRCMISGFCWPEIDILGGSIAYFLVVLLVSELHTSF